MQTTQQRQAAYRARQRALGRSSVTLLLTDDERFYMERVIEQMRRTGSVPAMMRRKNGTLEELDT